MLKEISLLALLVLVGCVDNKPRYKLGECYTEKTTENWQQKTTIKIIEIGNEQYRFIYYNLGGRKYFSPVWSTMYFDLVESGYPDKVTCPQ